MATLVEVVTLIIRCNKVLISYSVSSFVFLKLYVDSQTRQLEGRKIFRIASCDN